MEETHHERKLSTNQNRYTVRFANQVLHTSEVFINKELSVAAQFLRIKNNFLNIYFFQKSVSGFSNATLRYIFAMLENSFIFLIYN